MIDVKAAKKLILSGIAECAARDGFTSKISEQAFYLAKPFGRCIIHIGFIPHRTVDVDITADIAVRINVVETLVNENRANLSAREAESTATLGGDVGNLSEGKQKRWNLTAVNQSSEVSCLIYSKIREIAWPFFDRYSDMRNILTVLTSSAPRDWVLSPGHSARSCRAVALAFALGGGDNISAVVQICESLLLEKDPDALPEFSAFVDILKAKLEKAELPKLF